MPITDTSAVPLSSSTSRLQKGGIISGTACGSRISRIRWAYEKPSAIPPSCCAGSTDCSAPRTISEPYAP